MGIYRYFYNISKEVLVLGSFGKKYFYNAHICFYFCLWVYSNSKTTQKILLNFIWRNFTRIVEKFKFSYEYNKSKGQYMDVYIHLYAHLNLTCMKLAEYLSKRKEFQKTALKAVRFTFYVICTSFFLSVFEIFQQCS